MVVFAYFFIPQIFFYGIELAVRRDPQRARQFRRPMWTPVLNNLVVIGVGALFVLTAGLNLNTATISPGEVSSWASAPRWASSSRAWRCCRRCGGWGSAGGRGSTSVGQS
jgi:hypothetical protein